MTDTNEAKAQKFLNYIADNLPRLKKNLSKNITYNEYLFEEALQESIIKIYNSILKNGTDVSDYERYFYIVSKFSYIYLDNGKKKIESIEIRDILDNGKFDVIDDGNDEERFSETVTAIEKIRKNLTKEFGELKAEIYLEYMSKRSNGEKCSYTRLAKEKGLTSRFISETINSIKHYISNSDEISKIKKNYKEI